MRKPASFVCDVCEAEKGVANHWWIVSLSANRIVIEPWTVDAAFMAGVMHACGEQHLAQLISVSLPQLLAPLAQERKQP